MGWVVNATLLPLCTLGKTRYPLHRRLSGPQDQSAWVRKISPPLGFDTRTVQSVSYPGPTRCYKNIFAYGFLLGGFPKRLRKGTIKLVMFVRISAWNSASAAGEMFVRFHVRTFYYNFSFPSDFGYNRTKIMDILPEDRPKIMVPRRY